MRARWDWPRTGARFREQAFGILPKIREADDLLRSRPDLGNIVYEVHPEVSFSLLAGGQPMQHSKRKQQGNARAYLLVGAEIWPIVDRGLG